jgi:hypothetical protein
MLRFGNEISLCLFSRRICTLSACALDGCLRYDRWAAGTLWILSLPGSIAAPSGAHRQTIAGRMLFADPHLARLGASLGRRVVVISSSRKLGGDRRRIRQMVVDQAETSIAPISPISRRIWSTACSTRTSALGAPRRAEGAALFMTWSASTAAAAASGRGGVLMSSTSA